ncbi:MAG TPA: AAA family ATPase [Burkholderiaceae bacterium]|nr:AAA family ATPase [Burkholderiaceae bacterium]
MRPYESPRGRVMRGIHRWRFGPFDVDVTEHRLLKHGRVVPMTHKAFSLLVSLLHRPGELVSKADLFEQVWPGVVVTDAALSRAVHEVRSALGDSASEPTYIATAHGLGFRFIAPLVDEGAAPSAASRWLVGREAGLERLDAALAAVRLGQRRTVLVSGEPGIGKTALVEAFVARHASGHAAPWIAQGRCIEHYGAGEAHLPVLEALEQLAQRAGPAAFVDTFERYAPSWLSQLPWLARKARVGASERTDGETTPQRMSRELAHALDMLSLRTPIMLWLEDLHWSDPSSLELVAFLAGRRDPARLLLIASFRPAEAIGALHELALRLVQRQQAEELALRVLSPRELARYLALRFGSADRMPLDDLAAFIHRRSEGNALFAVSIIDELVRGGELVEEQGRWRLATGLPDLSERLPDSLRRLVHQQLEQLAPDDRRLVEAAAVVGAHFSAAAVAAALQADATDTEERCTTLARQGRLLEQQPVVVWPDGTAHTGFRFLHALHWQGVQERVPEGRRTEWQRRIAYRLEQAYDGQSTTVAGELALRFEAAREVECSLRYRRIAASAALGRCAYPEGIEQLRRGLALVPALPLERREREELDLLLPLGAALMVAAGYAAVEVGTVYDRALALCASCGGPQDLMRALRGQWNVAIIRSDMPTARAAAERLLAQAHALDDERMRVDAHSKLGQTCLHQGELQAARLHLERSLEAPPAAGDRAAARMAPRAAAYLAWAYWSGGEPRRAAETCARALALAEHADSPHSKAFALGYVAWVHVQRGELAIAQPLVTEQLRLARDYGLLYWQQVGEHLAGHIQAKQGAPAAGIALMREAIDSMQATGGKVGVPYLFCMLTEAALASGDLDQARAAMGAAAALSQSSGNALYAPEVPRLLGLIAQADGADLAAARRQFEHALAIANRQGSPALALRAAFCLARLFAQQGDLAAAITGLRAARNAFPADADGEDVTQADALLSELESRAQASTPSPLAGQR